MERYRLPLVREVPIPSDEEAQLPQPINYYYLARDVDSEMILKDAIIAELKQSVATLSRSNTRLRQKIDRLSS